MTRHQNWISQLLLVISVEQTDSLPFHGATIPYQSQSVFTWTRIYGDDSGDDGGDTCPWIQVR